MLKGLMEKLGAERVQQAEPGAGKNPDGVKLDTFPQPFRGDVGDTAVFTCAATSGNGSGLSYQWQELIGSTWTNLVNGGQISGATTASLSVSGIVLGDDRRAFQCAITNDTDTTYAGNAGILVPGWFQARDFPGAYHWWDEVGLVNGFMGITNPNQGPVAQENNSGARGLVYRETGEPDVRIDVTWNGIHGGGVGGPAACINPDADAFALNFIYEYGLFGGAWVLWALGRKPSDILNSLPGAVTGGIVALALEGGHVSGTDIDLRMEIQGSVVRCYGDGVLKITETVPPELVGSTRHGVLIDVNTNGPPRASDLPVVAYPFDYTAL